MDEIWLIKFKYKM